MAHSRPSTIAIDGPAASGKTTLGGLLAERLGYLFFDTGVLYRAITWAAQGRGLNSSDEAALAALAAELKIDLEVPAVSDGRLYTVRVDGRDVTWEIRRAEVDREVSIVSAYPQVRRALLERQRAIAAGGRVVMAGRDIGTVVLPEAGLKIYLDASPEERARRRYLELRARGESADYQEILARMRQRDELDREREAAPLRPAPDAIVLFTDGLSIEETFAKVWALVENWRQRRGKIEVEEPG
ncbi:MAG: (d)CMP kinase [Chloroflexi bacterium]|nr:(d)CMP kinase [Chloroflexota bacterium]